MNSDNTLIEVAVPLPLYNGFTYSCPSVLADRLAVGMRVLVPFGRRRLTAYVTGFPRNKPEYALKSILDVLDELPLFGEKDLDFYRWISDYYFHPLGETIRAALPSGINTDFASVVSLTEKGADRLKDVSEDFPERKILSALSLRRDMTFKALEKAVGAGALRHFVRRLVAQGLAEITFKQKGRIRIRKEKWYSALGAREEIRFRSKKQGDIFSYILEKKLVSGASLKEVFGSCSAPLKALEQKGLVCSVEKEIFRRPEMNGPGMVEPENCPTPAQTAVIRRLTPAIQDRAYLPVLLYGVTGSGKTEVYLQVMRQVLDQKRQCLYLVPEISLTSQLWDRIRSRLNVPIAMLHSGLTDAERYDAWRMIARGEVRVVLGARSAIFASFQDLGAIIVDEEHDPSYKQDEKLRYNARDLSLVRGKAESALVILGSATPSIESYHNALTKKYVLGTLPERVEKKTMPTVHIVDMRMVSALKKKDKSILSPALKKALADRLERGEQSLLFLNRRGFSSSYICQECGHVFRCPNCDVSLIHHLGQKKLCCHYCDHSIAVPEACPQCRSFFLVPTGWGTERLEKEIKRIFPEARIVRMDRDTTAQKGVARKMIGSVYAGETDILLGTQMIVKGYHLPKVTLVGVLNADQSLNFPDFHAGERTFQLLTQVAGRAGRGDVSGEVFIQTCNPDHYSLLCAQQHDFKRFFKKETGFRQELGYPPYRRIINIRFDSTSRARAESCAGAAGKFARDLLAADPGRPGIEVLGPASALWQKLKGRYRYQMLIKGGGVKPLRDFTARLLAFCNDRTRAQGVRVTIDVDPVFIA